MTQIYDLSDPAKPVFIRNFGLPGQELTAEAKDSPYELHGPISTGPKGNRIYLGYGTVRNGVIQILDREKLLNGPKEPTPENLLYPQIARIDTPSYMGAHTTLPVLGIEVADLAKFSGPKSRDIIVVVNESTSNECREARQMAYIVDITNEKTPFSIASFQVPETLQTFVRVADGSALTPGMRTCRRCTRSASCSCPGQRGRTCSRHPRSIPAA